MSVSEEVLPRCRSSGDDGAEAHHDIELVDEDGRPLAGRRLPDGVEGLSALHALIADQLAEDAESEQVIVGSRPTGPVGAGVDRRRSHRLYG